VTDETGGLAELSDYHPFGAYRTHWQHGSFREQRQFIGQEYDVDTGLSYLNARYYNPNTGRFTAQDPLFWTLSERYLLDPQEQNSYAYARNNPIAYSDPTGLLNLIIPGTWYDPNVWSKDSDAKGLYNNVSSTFSSGGYTVIMNMKSIWSGSDNDAARQQGANKIANIINGHRFKEGETLNIVAHSHGGNVAALLSQKVDHKIDTLVTLGTPSSEYRFDEKNIGEHINLYSKTDKVQSHGGEKYTASGVIAGLLCGFGCGAIGSRLGWGEFGKAGRTFEGAKNIEVSSSDMQRSGPVSSHSDLWQNSSIWNKYVKTSK